MDRTVIQIADRALEAFWSSVVQDVPDAQTGDLSPETTLQLQAIAESAITEWIASNASWLSN